MQHSVTVCKLLGDTTHIGITAVTQFTQISLAINIGGSTVCVDACVCALQQLQTVIILGPQHQAQTGQGAEGFAGGEPSQRTQKSDLVIMELDVIWGGSLCLGPRCRVQL